MAGHTIGVSVQGVRSKVSIRLVHPDLRESEVVMSPPLLPVAVLALALAIPLAGRASDDERDHDRARRALQAGEVLPLSTVLARLATTHPGQVLEVELERDGGRWIYEIKLLQPGGGLLKLKLDARTGEVLKHRTKGR